MKITLVTCILTFGICISGWTSVSGQTLSTTMNPSEPMKQVDEKTQKKINKATKDLAKDQQQLLKDNETKNI